MMRKYLSSQTIDGIQLSEREWECVSLLIRGKTAKMIASILNLSPRTVEHYLNNIKLKLNVDSKSELIEKVVNYWLFHSSNTETDIYE